MLRRETTERGERQQREILTNFLNTFDYLGEKHMSLPIIFGFQIGKKKL